MAWPIRRTVMLGRTRRNSIFGILGLRSQFDVVNYDTSATGTPCAQDHLGYMSNVQTVSLIVAAKLGCRLRIVGGVT